jgi:DMSO/TMAO reductase YedYZ molybdopterin-dependent catalytic subunit
VRARSVRHGFARLAVGGLIGVTSAGVAIGIGELAAASLRPAASPIIVVANKFILLTPEPVQESAIRTFGTHDKDALRVGIYLTIGLFAVILGVLALRKLIIGVIGLALFGVIGGYAALTVNAARTSDVIPTIVATAAGIATLVLLVRVVNRPAAAGTDAAGLAETGRVVANRRQFLAGTGAAVGVAAFTGLAGRGLQQARFDATKSRAAVRLPAPSEPAPALPAGVDLGKSGMPFVTPNADFYRVDTAITVPQVDAAAWRLRVTGLVDRPLTLTFEELLDRPLIERYVTMTCVSNDVGGPYISTARFLGARLADVLRDAGVHPTADQIVGRSVDGMTIGTPTAVIMDGRDAMLAVGMNGAPLPIEHGFPVRMVVPGLYGYVSGCKWIVELQVTRFADFDAYWVQQGWAAQGPIRLESRIDTPHPFGQVRVGRPLAVAGVAWHQHVGIRKVEVQVDDEPWLPARLARTPSIDTWVQWVLPWTPMTPGSHTLRVRATDASGAVQDQARREPFPSGASGWHTVLVHAT